MLSRAASGADVLSTGRMFCTGLQIGLWTCGGAYCLGRRQSHEISWCNKQCSCCSSATRHDASLTSLTRPEEGPAYGIVWWSLSALVLWWGTSRSPGRKEGSGGRKAVRCARNAAACIQSHSVLECRRGRITLSGKVSVRLLRFPFDYTTSQYKIPCQQGSIHFRTIPGKGSCLFGFQTRVLLWTHRLRYPSLNHGLRHL